jgi:hypothetical protein
MQIAGRRSRRLGSRLEKSGKGLVWQCIPGDIGQYNVLHFVGKVLLTPKPIIPIAAIVKISNQVTLSH